MAERGESLKLPLLKIQIHLTCSDTTSDQKVMDPQVISEEKFLVAWHVYLNYISQLL